MQQYYISIAGYTIKISLYPAESSRYQEWFEEHLQLHYAEFLVTKRPHKIHHYLDIKWDNKEEMVVREDARFYLHLFTKRQDNRTVTHYQITTNQLQIVIRYILHSFLIRDNGFLLHGSSVLIGKKAYIFTGRSGAGKSTAAALLKSKYPRLSDDIIIIKKVKGIFMMYQTPILEKNPPDQLGNEPIPLGKIFFLRKANRFVVDSVKSNTQTFERILKQLFITKNEEVRTLAETISELLERENILATLYFAKDENKMLEFFRQFDENYVQNK